MPIHVAFQQPAWGGSEGSPFAGGAMKSEAIADGATGSLTADDGQVAIVANTGSDLVYVAHGSTPDASATAATNATSARYCIPSGQVIGFAVAAGDKFGAAAS